jgi:hypothetical protein
MAEGGTLAFGLRHIYPIERDLKHVHNVLKGSDAVVFQSVRALGFEPVLYVYYDESFHNGPPTGVIVDQLPGCYEASCSEETIFHFLQNEQSGIPVCQDGGEIFEDCDHCFANILVGVETVEWVTPVTVYNRQKGAFQSYAQEEPLTWVYGDVCMIVRIGRAGDRLAYPTVAQMKKAHPRAH